MLSVNKYVSEWSLQKKYKRGSCARQLFWLSDRSTQHTESCSGCTRFIPGAHTAVQKRKACVHTHSQACTHTPTHTHPHIPSGTFRSTLFCYCTTVGIINRLEKDYSINPLRDCFYSCLCNISQSQPIMPQPVNETQWVMRVINLSLN